MKAMLMTIAGVLLMAVSAQAEVKKLKLLLNPEKPAAEGFYYFKGVAPDQSYNLTFYQNRLSYVVPVEDSEIGAMRIHLEKAKRCNPHKPETADVTEIYVNEDEGVWSTEVEDAGLCQSEPMA